MREIEKKYRDKETGKLLFVAWLTIISYDLTGEDVWENDCVLQFSMPFIDVKDYVVTNEIYTKMREAIIEDVDADIEWYLEDICTIITWIKGIENLYLPDFLIKDNEVNMSLLNRMMDTECMVWEELLTSLTVGLGKVSVLTDMHNDYLFRTSKFLLDNMQVYEMKKIDLSMLMEQIDENVQNIILDIFSKDDECFCFDYCDEKATGTAFVLRDCTNEMKLICAIDI